MYAVFTMETMLQLVKAIFNQSQKFKILNFLNQNVNKQKFLKTLFSTKVNPKNFQLLGGGGGGQLYLRFVETNS